MRDIPTSINNKSLCQGAIFRGGNDVSEIKHFVVNNKPRIIGGIVCGNFISCIVSLLLAGLSGRGFGVHRYVNTLGRCIYH